MHADHRLPDRRGLHVPCPRDSPTHAPRKRRCRPRHHPLPRRCRRRRRSRRRAEPRSRPSPAAELVATTIDGMRVRQRPGTDARVIAGLLPPGAELEVVMGPILNEGLGWYLVHRRRAARSRASPRAGWRRASSPSRSWRPPARPPAARAPPSRRWRGPATPRTDPSRSASGDHAIRWVAADPERQRCAFAVILQAGRMSRCRPSAPRSATMWCPARSSPTLRRARRARPGVRPRRLRLRVGAGHRARARGDA